MRLQGLDATRGFAALAVMLFHYLPLNGDARWLPNGYLAVDLFFCLSGFVLSLSYTQRIRDGLGFKPFLIERLIRLHPLYVAGLLLGLLCASIDNQSENPGGPLWRIALQGLFYIPTLAPNWVQFGHELHQDQVFPLNNPSWSLMFELAVGFTLLVAARTRSWLLLLGVALAAAAWLKTASITGQLMNGGWGIENLAVGAPRTLTSFLMGICVHRFWAWWAPRKPWPAVNQAWLMAGLLALFIVPPSVFHKTVFLLIPSALVFFPLIVLLNIKTTLRPGSPWLLLGELSYPLYVLHVPMYMLVEKIMFGAGVPRASASVIVTAIACTLITSHLLAKHCDQPLRAWLKRRFQPLPGNPR